ncbi:hypothetical protein BURK_031099 [Burkholderia sp. SJ98]|jgi:hypothetical protein|nr:hypothetical protein BURK_031099 [Burkholderia sp. SJ98]
MIRAIGLEEAHVLQVPGQLGADGIQTVQTLCAARIGMVQRAATLTFSVRPILVQCPVAWH